MLPRHQLLYRPNYRHAPGVARWNRKDLWPGAKHVPFRFIPVGRYHRAILMNSVLWYSCSRHGTGLGMRSLRQHTSGRSSFGESSVPKVSSYQHPHCVLCPQDASIVSIKAKKRPPADFDVLSCLKITEGRQWAHVLCASWIPEVQFTNVAAYKAIENISLIPSEKREGVSPHCTNEADSRYVHYVASKMGPLLDVRIVGCCTTRPVLGLLGIGSDSNSVS